MILYHLLLLAMLIEPMAYCEDALHHLPEARFPTSRASCVRIVIEARRQRVDPVAALAVGYHETRLRNLPSHTGRRLLAAGVPEHRLPEWVERGPMQAKPRALCPARRAEGCDFVRVAVTHLCIQRLRAARALARLPRAQRLRASSSVLWRDSFARYRLPAAPDFRYGLRVEAHRRRLAMALEVKKRLTPPSR